MGGEEAARVLQEAEERMKKAVDVTREDLAGVRTGRASPALVSRIPVDYYGTQVPLSQLATFSVPEARLLVIQPFDRAAIPAIEKAIFSSELGVTPSNDGRVIRLAFPPLTEERRRELSRLVRQRAEEGRVAIRNVRRHEKERLERMEEEGLISEDELRRFEKELQRLTEKYISEVDRVLEAKEKELLEG